MAQPRFPFHMSWESLPLTRAAGGSGAYRPDGSEGGGVSAFLQNIGHLIISWEAGQYPYETVL